MSSSYRKTAEKHFRIEDPLSGYDKRFVLKTFRLPNGSLENFFIDKNKDSVQIFALTLAKSVICIQTFRAGPEQLQIELPGGGIEEGEDPKSAALRELKEETSYVPKKIEHLVTLDYSPYSIGKRHSFIALECESVGNLDLDPNEFLKVVIMPQEAFREKLKLGAIRGADVAYMSLERLGLLS
jgi:ADP-ribose pyrophosphatase